MPDQTTSGLYFILNAAVGIIKIGIAQDVYARKNQLEMTCGLPLDILRFVPDGQRYEQDLHLAFHATRLRGEWFAPSEELLALIDGEKPIHAFLDRQQDAMRQVVADRQAAAETERQARDVIIRAERDALRRLNAEKKRLAAERARKLAERRQRKDERDRVEHAARQSEWAARVPAAVRDRLVSPPRAQEAATRRDAIARQRHRNAALLGVPMAEAGQ